MPLSKIVRDSLSTGIDDNSDATAITIDSSERVGINTNSPEAMLQVQNGDITVGWADNFIGTQFQSGSDYRLGMKFGTVNRTTKIIAEAADNNGEITFEINGSEKARISSVGKVGIGDSSPDSPLEVRKDNPDNGRLATFGSNGTPFTSVLSGLSNSISIGRSRINVAPNTTTSLVSGYGGSVVLVTLLHDSGVADVQRTVLVSHAWSGATVLFENNYGGNSPTVTFSALSGALRVNHNHSGNIQFNVAGFIIAGPNTG